MEGRLSSLVLYLPCSPFCTVFLLEQSCLQEPAENEAGRIVPELVHFHHHCPLIEIVVLK